jgi:ribonucleoside-diphosphate reductase alpha chain
MTELYAAAWRMGVKTTYYLHMMPRHTAEQSTVKVNKAESSTPAGGAVRRGFGAAKPAARGLGAVVVAEHEVVPDEVVELEVVDGAACPVDPQERLNCESCQ